MSVAGSTVEQFRVEPLPVRAPDNVELTEAEKAALGFPGGLKSALLIAAVAAFVLFAGLSAMVSSTAGNASCGVSLLLLMGSSLLLPGAVVLHEAMKSSQAKGALEKKREAALWAERERTLREAQELTERLRRGYSLELGLEATVREGIGRIEKALGALGELFERPAYEPFWESFFDARELVAGVQGTIEEQERFREHYEESLAGREHNFPALPLDGGQLQSLKGDLDASSQKVEAERERALTNLGFAMILEQWLLRKTLSATMSSLEWSLNQGLRRLIAQNVQTNKLRYAMHQESQQRLAEIHATAERHRQVAQSNYELNQRRQEILEGWDRDHQARKAW